MVKSGYNVSHYEEVPLLRMADVEDVANAFESIGVRNLDEETLRTEEMKVKIWEIPAGEQMGAHGHEAQEEFYFVLRGTFEITIGPPGDLETREVGSGGVFAASPNIVRGYRNVGTEDGRVLVVAAPNVSDRGIPPDGMTE